MIEIKQSTFLVSGVILNLTLVILVALFLQYFLPHNLLSLFSSIFFMISILVLELTIPIKIKEDKK